MGNLDDFGLDDFGALKIWAKLAVPPRCRRRWGALRRNPRDALSEMALRALGADRARPQPPRRFASRRGLTIYRPDLRAPWGSLLVYDAMNFVA